MQKVPSAFATALVLALAVPQLSAQRGDRAGPGRDVPRAQFANFEFQDAEFDSKNLTDGKGRYGVYLPKGWRDEANKDKTWPLIVWLHGFGGYAEFQGRGGAKTLDELRGSGALPDVVFVAFQAPGGRRSRSVYVNGEQSGKVEDAIVQDLVADAVENFHASPDRSQHAIMGISIGGFGALKIAMRHPDVFAIVAAHSSAVFADDPKALPEQYARQVQRAMQMGLGEVFGDPIDQAKWAAEMPMGIARKAAKGAFANLRIYFDAGTEDRYGFAEPNVELSKLMDKVGIEHTFQLVEGGGHAWSSEAMLVNLRRSLTFVGKALVGKAAGDAKAPVHEHEGGEHKGGESKGGEHGGGEYKGGGRE